MNEVEISYKFQNLFQLLDDDYYPEIDTVIITGGRYSLKSYTVSIFSIIALIQKKWSCLYTRYTNMSISDSVKPEVTDKLELLGVEDLVKNTQTQIEYYDSRISFKGIKTGSLGQTANLKSLSGFNVFINDEAEELPDYNTFKKIFYSIRSTEKRNLTILILNPTTKLHWIFKKFFEEKGLKGGENCILDNVMYIHTSYLDADKNKMPKNILKDYENLKYNNPNEYENIVLGGWLSGNENSLFKKEWFKISEYQNERKVIFIDGAYTNNKMNDPTGILITSFNGKRILIHNYIRVWYTLAELLREFPNIAEQNNISGRDEILVEPKASGKDVVSMFQAMFSVPTNEYTGNFIKSSKMERAQTSAPYCQSGNVYLIAGSWNEVFVQELQMFPNAKHDEAIDLLAYAIEHFLIQRDSFIINV